MKFLLTFILLSIVASAMGADFYVGQNAAGSNNGADAADAYPLTWLNNVAHWDAGAGTVSPGDTVHLVGTFTSPLILSGSGAAGNPITLHFESGSNFTLPCWPSAGAIQLEHPSYLVIDGGVNGLIQNTANGTGLANSTNSEGIVGQIWYSTIQNLTIKGMYAKNPAVADPNRYGYCIDVSGSYLTVKNCALSDGDALITFSGPEPGGITTVNNIQFLNNTFRNFNHGLNLGIGNSAASGQNVIWNNCTIAGNNFDWSANWDNAYNGSSYVDHLDNIIFFSNSYDPTIQMNGLYIYQNTFGSNFGVHNTASIFLDLSNNAEQLSNVYIYNNLFLASANSWGNGFIAGGGSNCWIFNNTFYGTATTGGGVETGGSNCFIYNNILYSGGGFTLAAATNGPATSSQSMPNDNFIVSSYFQTEWSDYNCIPGTYPTFQWILYDFTGDQPWISGEFTGLNNWKDWYDEDPGLETFSELHADPHSTASMPVFNPGTYVPAASDTVAHAAGKNLTALLPNNPTMLTDFNGNPHPATGNWTIGAFEAAGIPPAAPQNLRVQ
jgi:hypothetical protein